MNLPALDHPDKETEIAALQKLVNWAQAGGDYLASLLTPALVEWFTANVRSDVSTNLVEDAIAAERERLQLSLAKEIEAAETQRVAARLRDDIQRLESVAESLRTEVSNLQGDLANTREHWGDDVRRLAEVGQQVWQLQEENTRLKAQLWDRSQK